MSLPLLFFSVGRGGSWHAVREREAVADPLDDLLPLGRVLQEALRAPPLHHLGDRGRHGRKRRAPDARLLREQRPLVRPLRVGRVAAPLLHVHQPPEGGVAGDHPHGARGRVHGGALHAEHHVADAGAGGERAEQERERRSPARDGAHGVEPAGARVDAPGQRLHVQDVGERRGARRRVGELAPRRRGDAVPGVEVHVLLRVRDHHCRCRAAT
uniref:Predicted protein n=1 Tax=Hordeum vulgare subsp. vulgare TaxID=112509 RepID=F2DTS7_HORVV|nr:predicted protein [Hordeum vulgare subsp. vulgare]